MLESLQNDKVRKHIGVQKKWIVHSYSTSDAVGPVGARGSLSPTRAHHTRHITRHIAASPPTCHEPIWLQAAEHVRASAYDAQGVRRGAPRAERAPKKILRVVEG